MYLDEEVWRRSSVSFLPPSPPSPEAATYSPVTGTGSISFDKPLDKSVPLNPSDWLRGTGAGRRSITSLSYGGASSVVFTGMSAATMEALAAGYWYTVGDNPLRGANGQQVAAFEAFTG